MTVRKPRRRTAVSRIEGETGEEEKKGMGSWGKKKIEEGIREYVVDEETVKDGGGMKRKGTDS